MTGAIWKELQRVASFACYEKVHKGGDPVNKKQRNLMLKDLFHGTDGTNSCGFMQQLVEGKQCFATMFESHNATGFDIPDRLKLKAEYTAYNNTSFYVGKSPPDFTLDSLRCKNMTGDGGTLVGSTILSQAQNSQTNCKKAIGYSMTFLQKNTARDESTGMTSHYYTLPSGKSEKDHNEYVLDKMFEETGIKEDVKAHLVATNQPLPKRPPGWFFAGYGSFVRAGLLREAKHQSSLFMPEAPSTSTTDAGTTTKKRKGRKELRAEKHAEKVQKTTNARAAESAASDRSLLARHKLLLQQEHSMDMSYNEISALVSSLRGQLASEIQLVQYICPIYDPNNDNWIKIQKLRDRIDIANMQMCCEHANNQKKRASLAKEHEKVAAEVTGTGMGTTIVENNGSDDADNNNISNVDIDGSGINNDVENIPPNQPALDTAMPAGRTPAPLTDPVNVTPPPTNLDNLLATYADEIGGALVDSLTEH